MSSSCSLISSSNHSSSSSSRKNSLQPESKAIAFFHICKKTKIGEVFRGYDLLINYHHTPYGFNLIHTPSGTNTPLREQGIIYIESHDKIFKILSQKSCDCSKQKETKATTSQET